MTVMTKPQQSFRLEPVHPKPEEAHTMPYAPAVHDRRRLRSDVPVGRDAFAALSQASACRCRARASALDRGADHARDGGDQVDPRRYRRELARRREGDEVSHRFPRCRRHARDHGQIFRRLAAGKHHRVHQSAVVAGRAHRARHDRGAAEESHGDASIPSRRASSGAEYPRFSDAEMARRRAAVEALLAAAECDHLRVLRRQSLRLGGAMADAMAGDRRGGRRADAGRARRAVRAICQPRAAGADARRQGRCGVGRRSRRSPQRSRCWSSAARATRSRCNHRASQRRAARGAVGKIRQTEKPQPRLHPVAAGEVGRRTRLAAHRRAFQRSRHGGAARWIKARAERTRARRSGRACLRFAGCDQCHSLHRRRRR